MTDKINKYAEFMTKQVKEGSFGYPSKSGKQGVGVDSRGPVEDAVESLDEARKPRGVPIVGRTPEQKKRMEASRKGAEGIQQKLDYSKGNAKDQAENGRNEQDNLKQDGVDRLNKKKNVDGVLDAVSKGLSSSQKEHFKKWAGMYGTDGNTPIDRHVITQDFDKNRKNLAKAYLTRYSGDFRKIQHPATSTMGTANKAAHPNDAADAAHQPLTNSAHAIHHHINNAKQAAADGDTERVEYNNNEAKAHARHILNNRNTANELINTNKGNIQKIAARGVENQPARRPGLLARMFNAGQTHLTHGRRAAIGDRDSQRQIAAAVDSVPSHSDAHDAHIRTQDSSLSSLKRHLGSDNFDHVHEEVKFSDYVAWIAEGDNYLKKTLTVRGNAPDGKIHPYKMSDKEAAENVEKMKDFRRVTQYREKRRKEGK